MKSSKTPRQTAKNASKLHKHVGELLTNSQMFKQYIVRQEYRVSAVNPNFESNREKFDWAILGAKIIVEVHGQQHYGPVRFGGIDEDQAKRNFSGLRERDEAKRQAAEEAGWAYIVVKYNEPNITEDELLQRIRDTLANMVVRSSFEKIKKIVAKSVKQKAKIPKPDKYNWPKGKIPSRPFPRKKK